MFRGLLEKMPNENVLATVMAHEIAHIKHRHPVSALGRGMVLAVLMGVVSVSVGSDIVDNLVGEAGLMTALAFNRDQEVAADASALQALQARDGHVAGAGDLFQIIERIAGDTHQPPALWRSHPANDARIAEIQTLAQQNHWPQNGEMTPLPVGFRGWLQPEMSQ